MEAGIKHFPSVMETGIKAMLAIEEQGQQF